VKGDLLTPIWTAAVPPALSPHEWERLLAQARRARLDGRLARWWSDHGGLAQVPEGPRAHLESALRRVRRLHDQTRWEADCVRRALQHLPTPIVFLKGAAYVLAGLPPARGRLFEDVDVLVAREQLRAVEMALFAAGWIARRLDPYDERYYRDLSHELPPLQHVERGTALDVHHAITPPTSRFAVAAAPLLALARPLPDAPRLAVLAPTDMVLHSAAHLMQDGEFGGGQRDVLDCADLIAHFALDPSFWPALVARARELHLGVALHDVVTQARRIGGLQVPAEAGEALRALAPHSLRNRIMQRLLGVALRPDHPDCDSTWSGSVRWLLYVRSHWLRMPWYQIVPHLARKAWMRVRAKRVSKPDERPMFGRHG